jgi:hypothetical protein
MKLKSLFTWCTMCFVFIQFASGQEKQDFLFTKGDNNISIITMGSVSSPHCTVVEYPEFLVVHEIPTIPIGNIEQDSIKGDDDKANPLISFIDSIYLLLNPLNIFSNLTITVIVYQPLRLS